jgi:hypothetical protein
METYKEQEDMKLHDKFQDDQIKNHDRDNACSMI